MVFVEVLDVSALPSGQKARVTVNGKDLLLANLDGDYFAVANKCTHLGGSLVKGDLDGNIITCPRHGAQFDLKTGKATGDARIAILKMSVKDLESYQVKVEGSKILVGLPE